MTKLKLIFFSIAILLFAQSSFGQSLKKWGEVTKEEFDLKYCAFDSTAKAVKLFDYGFIQYGMHEGEYKQMEKRHIRIKILDKSETDRGDVRIFFHKKYDELFDIEAVAYNINKTTGKLEENKVGKKLIYEKDYSSFYKFKTFAIPNVKEGTIIEYRYTIASTSASISDWDLQDDIPTYWSELEAKIPLYYKYLVLLENTKSLDITEEKDYTQYIPWSAFSNLSSESSACIKGKHFRYVKKNIPALIEEDYITTMEDYTAKINFNLISVFYPKHELQKFATTWDDVAKTNLDRDTKYFGEKFKIKNAAKTKAHQLTDNLTTPKDKVIALYDFISKNYQFSGRRRWLENYVFNVFEKTKGSSCELNMLLVLMLQEIGIDAKPAFISTRDHGRIQMKYPTDKQFNNALCYVKLSETEELFLDATSPIRSYDMLDANNLNYYALVLNKKTAEWKEIPVYKRSSIKSATNIKLLTNGGFTGNIMMQEKGYFAYNSRVKLVKQEKEELKKRKFNFNSTIQLGELKIKNEKDLDKALMLSIDLKKEAAGNKELDIIYFSPVFHNYFTVNNLKLDYRHYPVDFGYPTSYTMLTTIEVPKGYTLQDKAKPVKMSLPNGGGTIMYNVAERGNTIQIITKVQIKKARYFSDEYPTLKKFFEEAVGIMKQKLVFVREKQ